MAGVIVCGMGGGEGEWRPDPGEIVPHCLNWALTQISQIHFNKSGWFIWLARGYPVGRARRCSRRPQTCEESPIHLIFALSAGRRGDSVLFIIIWPFPCNNKLLIMCGIYYWFLFGEIRSGNWLCLWLFCLQGAFWHVVFTVDWAMCLCVIRCAWHHGDW